jgi:hypothetical protein
MGNVHQRVVDGDTAAHGARQHLVAQPCRGCPAPRTAWYGAKSPMSIAVNSQALGVSMPHLHNATSACARFAKRRFGGRCGGASQRALVTAASPCKPCNIGAARVNEASSRRPSGSAHPSRKPAYDPRNTACP